MCMAKEAVQFVNRFGPGDIAAESGRIPGGCICALQLGNAATVGVGGEVTS